MTKKSWQTEDGHIKESAIKEAQAVIEAVMAECNFWSINIQDDGDARCYPIGTVGRFRGKSLAELYVNRLHEIDGAGMA